MLRWLQHVCLRTVHEPFSTRAKALQSLKAKYAQKLTEESEEPTRGSTQAEIANVVRSLIARVQERTEAATKQFEGANRTLDAALSSAEQQVANAITKRLYKRYLPLQEDEKAIDQQQSRAQSDTSHGSSESTSHADRQRRSPSQPTGR